MCVGAMKNCRKYELKRGGECRQVVWESGSNQGIDLVGEYREWWCGVGM